MYHATTIDKVEKMNGYVGIGKKVSYFTTDFSFAINYARRVRIRRGVKASILICDVDEKKASNYHKQHWRTNEKAEILFIIRMEFDFGDRHATNTHNTPYNRYGYGGGKI